MTFGSLFAGIGGFDLGLERAGMKCKWQVEIDPYATRVLEKHWPHVKRWNDVRTFPPKEWTEEETKVDLICGGFPCQDISAAGEGAGIISGSRSGLWVEYAKIIRALRPRYAFVENVSALTYRGLGRVLGDLADLGMDAEWYSIPAKAFGAPHSRERIWIIAYANGVGRCHAPLRYNALRLLERVPAEAFRIPKLPQSPVCGMDDGIPDRVDRLRCLGNAVVPQVAEWIGRRILESANDPR